MNKPYLGFFGVNYKPEEIYDIVVLGNSNAGMFYTHTECNCGRYPQTGGNCSEHVLKAISSDEEQNKSKKVLILMGKNDFCYRQGNCRTLENIIATVEECHRVFPEADVYVANIFNKSDYGMNAKEHEETMKQVSFINVTLKGRYKDKFIDYQPDVFEWPDHLTKETTDYITDYVLRK
jgi:hypothetical protein